MAALRLHGYWRSSTTYRLRIALQLKQLPYETVPVNLLAGDHQAQPYLAINPYGTVPLLEAEGTRRAQSMAVLEWLDERYPERPLLPREIDARFLARELAMAIATELHAPLNLSVLRYLREELGHAQDAVDRWYRHWLARTLASVEARLEALDSGDFLDGDGPGYFECVLVPQLYNARRFACDLAPYPRLARIEAACLAHPAFIAALPENQPDARRAQA